jgi:uncharacterized membrane protein YoaK (UPF0700 family)
MPKRFRMILGISLLAFFAAWTNIIFIAEFGVSVSHMTGDISKLSLEVILNKHIAYLYTLAVTSTAFILGAGISGAAISQGVLRFGRPYGIAIIGQALLLTLSFFMRPYSVMLCCGLAACACGMQNALASVYRGVILRTTHVTGLLTDLGHSLGMLISGKKLHSWKIAVYIMILAGFISGALVGGLSYFKFGFKALLLVAAGYAVSGSIYFYNRVFHRGHNH